MIAKIAEMAGCSGLDASAPIMYVSGIRFGSLLLSTSQLARWFHSRRAFFYVAITIRITQYGPKPIRNHSANPHAYEPHISLI